MNEQRRPGPCLECHTLKDYHDHYLTLDVTLLADVFENFREKAIGAYQLDPPTTGPSPDTAGMHVSNTRGRIGASHGIPTCTFVLEDGIREGFHGRSSSCQIQLMDPTLTPPTPPSCDNLHRRTISLRPCDDARPPLRNFGGSSDNHGREVYLPTSSGLWTIHHPKTLI